MQRNGCVFVSNAVNCATMSKKTSKTKKSAAKESKSKKKPPMSKTADRHALYQMSVQDVESEIDFVDETYTQLRAKKASLLREDFCGTANTSCEWVRRRRKNTAIGVDIDPEVLAWGQQYNLARLKKSQQERVQLIEQDVMQVQTDPVDIVLAMNFSYWFFKERPQLRKYFRKVHSALASDGIFFLDAFGGYDAHKTIRERRDCEGFVYTWQQAAFNPINNDMRCAIHFSFPDGSKLRNAFTYEWRFWSLPELREVLLEAGFSKVDIYWQGWDDDEDEPDGNFVPTLEAESDPGWISYIVAQV